MSNDDPHGVKHATKELMAHLTGPFRLTHDEAEKFEWALSDYVRAHATERAGDALDMTFNRGAYRG